MKGLEQEWLLLQQQYENYEQQSLYLKSVTVLFSAFICWGKIDFGVVFVALLFLIDCMLKTFQQRLELRLFTLEKQINDNNQERGFYLYHQWQSQPRGLLSLIREYVRVGLRPTQAVVYLVLLMFLGLVQFSLI